ncbi:carbonic anhydrase [Palleronia sp. KMU-117]|uniref:carbonic anhydrase n=1 Tax=Palleronia sp. KMU-117 TaxID=3434108 RepID=UPI003D757B86
MVQDLLRRNREWAAERHRAEPEYFRRLADQQTPEFFWIGCSDSRVPANVIAGLDPGEIFVHRNVANVVHSADMNLLSTLEYAVEMLGIRKVIVTGHYGCGGVKAAMAELSHALSDHWLEPIRQLGRTHREELRGLTKEAHENRLAELNVIAGVAAVAATPILHRAWSRGAEVVVHGLIYGLKDGLLSDLGCSVSRADWLRSQSEG